MLDKRIAFPAAATVTAATEKNSLSSSSERIGYLLDTLLLPCCEGERRLNHRRGVLARLDGCRFRHHVRRSRGNRRPAEETLARGRCRRRCGDLLLICAGIEDRGERILGKRRRRSDRHRSPEGGALPEDVAGDRRSWRGKRKGGHGWHSIQSRRRGGGTYCRRNGRNRFLEERHSFATPHRSCRHLRRCEAFSVWSETDCCRLRTLRTDPLDLRTWWIPTNSSNLDETCEPQSRVWGCKI